MREKKIIAFILAAILLLGLVVLVGSCSRSGSMYYHVPGVSVDVDKSKRHYKPSAPKPAPKLGGGFGRKR